MPKMVTVAALYTSIRQAANMVGSTFVDDATELLPLINTYYAELRDKLVEHGGPARFADIWPLVTVAGTQSVAIPAPGSGSKGEDLFQVLGVDVTLSNGGKISATPFNFHQRNAYQHSLGWVRGQPVWYRLHGNAIWFLPIPDSAYAVDVHYLPVCPVLTGASSLDGINGWERYIIARAAIALLDKEESDTSVLHTELASLTRRIEGLANSRDAAYPDKIVDVRGRRARVR